MAEIEIRNYNTSEVRACDKEKRTVEGYAAVFNSESRVLDGEFVEIIDRNAFDGVIETNDVFALLNHKNDRGILARSNHGVGSLKLSIDDRGLKYEFEAPNTALGDEVLEYLRRGDISQSSFAFTVDKDKWEKRDNNLYVRTIKHVGRLVDVSPVFTPAYEATSVSCRSFDAFKEEEQKALEAAKAEEERQAAELAAKKEQEIKDYYAQLRADNEAYLKKD